MMGIRRSLVFRLLVAASLTALAGSAAGAANDTRAWPARVLITNDNGIEDVRLVALARAFAEVAETWVVAATTDRSGTSNLISAVRTGTFRVESRDLGEGIEAYALDGYPADCVLFALSGPMREHPPDLVISGINGGPNMGDDWFGSGTIGAARTAAYVGVPALAVSGLSDDDPAVVRAAAQWVVELARSEVVRDLRAPQYLTISLPLLQARHVSGVEAVSRARGLISGGSRPVGEESATTQTWQLEFQTDPSKAPEDSDVAAVGRGHIAIVPMRVDESDPQLLAHLRREPDRLPGWSTPEPAEGGDACRSGFGAMIDDAEDASGREWGVLIEEVLAGGKAEEIGLLPGDVVVSLNGVALEVDRRSREDPDDRFVGLMRKLGCGDTVSLEYVRDGKRSRAEFRIPTEPDPSPPGP
jgi:5'-nucleotidase